MDGGTFYYPNPLSVDDNGYERKPWFGCACCPSNISRFIPSLPGYVYAVKNDQVYVNLFMGNKATIKTGNKNIVLEQETNYPWNGDVKLKVEKGSGEFTLNIRIPGWVQNKVVDSDLYNYADQKNPTYSISVNGEKITGELVKGYFQINRKWRKNDVVEIHFDMIPRLVKANEKVKDDQGRLAIECGPLVYCAEWVDNKCDVNKTLIAPNSELKIQSQPNLLNGVNTISTEGQFLKYDSKGKLLIENVPLTFIPYYSYAHRGKGAMNVWMPYKIEAF